MADQVEAEFRRLVGDQQADQVQSWLTSVHERFEAPQQMRQMRGLLALQDLPLRFVAAARPLRFAAAARPLRFVSAAGPLRFVSAALLLRFAAAALPLRSCLSRYWADGQCRSRSGSL